MADQFINFAKLKEEMTDGRDYRIVHEIPNSSLAAIVAPYGGKIEPHTSGLARLIAGKNFAFYAFEGMLPSGNRRLHITSHNFDEPIALNLIAKVDVVLGIHGMQDRSDNVDVCLGGLDGKLIDHLSDELQNIGINSLKSGHEFLATNRKNICNRGRFTAGGQLELSSLIRNKLFHSGGKNRLATFVDSIRRAILSRLG